MFNDIEKMTVSNFLELKMWILKIAKEDTVSKGLFFVYAYGIYEQIIRLVISRTIEIINSQNIKLNQCIYELYSLAFAGEYESFYNTNKTKQWPKRWKISHKFTENEVIQIPLEIIPTDGKNIRFEQLQSIANSFGVKNSVLPKPQLRNTISELVNHRNNIAHGNQLPKVIGGGVTTKDLLAKCAEIESVCLYVIAIYDKYIVEKKYLLNCDSVKQYPHKT